MNLILDIGNSQSKAALFSDGKLCSLNFFRGEITLRQLKKFLGQKREKKFAILSSVINHSPALVKFLNNNFSLLVLEEKTPLPFKNLYETPGTLGKDRIANAAGASLLFPGKNVLSVDAGTCIKYDFVNNKNEYLGGAISPGLTMRFQALHNYTAQLPLLKISMKKPELIGKNTVESILSGVQNGVFAEVTRFITRYREKYEEVNIIFTGGDYPYFKTLFSKKNRIFAAPDLTLQGLNNILDYNESD